MSNYHLLNSENAHALYDLLRMYSEREVEDEIHQIFDGVHFNIPNHWRDEQQFQRSYHTIHRLACELGPEEFSIVAVEGEIDQDELTIEELDYFFEPEVVEDECYFLYDFLTCLDFEKKDEEVMRHLGLG